MFITVVLTIAIIWNQTVSINGIYIYKQLCVYICNIYTQWAATTYTYNGLLLSDLKMYKMISSIATQIEPETITLSEILTKI